MREITLTQGFVTWVDDADYECLNQYKWHAQIIRKYGRPDLVYAARAVRDDSKRSGKRRVYMHRAISGCTPLVDHKNGNGLDNQRSNLRPATVGQNKVNQVFISKGTTSKYKGVRRVKGHVSKPWIATIMTSGISTYLGYFANEEDAARAYDEAAMRIHGEFARFNFPEAVGGLDGRRSCE